MKSEMVKVRVETKPNLGICQFIIDFFLENPNNEKSEEIKCKSHLVHKTNTVIIKKSTKQFQLFLSLSPRPPKKNTFHFSQSHPQTAKFHRTSVVFLPFSSSESYSSSTFDLPQNSTACNKITRTFTKLSHNLIMQFQ
jgi:hypothetical protein